MKLFFALVAVFIFSTNPSFSQSEDVKWFESVFNPTRLTTSEKEIASKENEKLIAIENNDPSRQVKIMMELGAIQLIKVKSREKAMELFIEALAIEDSLRLDHDKLFTLLAFGRVFEDVFEFDKSIEYITQAEQLNEKLKDPDLLVLVLKEAGRVYTKRGDADIAIQKYELILSYTDEFEAKDKQSDAMYNLGRLYMHKGDYQKALEFHKKALAILRSIRNKREEAKYLNSFAELYLHMKNPDRAMANQLATLDISKELKDNRGVASSYNRIGEIYFGKKEYDKAITNFQSALKLARETQQQDEIRKSYDYLSKSYKEKKDFAKSLEYRELFIAIDDFIRNENSSLQLTDARNRYMLVQKEKEINVLEGDRLQRDKVIEDQARLQTLLFAVLALGLIIVGLVTYLYMVKGRLAKSLKEVNDAKDQLFSIIGHDIKGPLNSLSSFASLLKDHGDSITKEEIKVLSTDLDKSLKNLLALLENLLQWARTQTGNMEFDRKDADVVKLLNENRQLLAGQAAAKGITIISNYDKSLIARFNSNSINTVIRNLLSNAIKFTPRDGKIILKAESNKDHLMISVIDSGVGIDPASLEKLFKVGTKHSTLGTASEKGTGLGLILCKEFVEKNGGIIGVTSKVGEGSRFYFTIPLS